MSIRYETQKLFVQSLIKNLIETKTRVRTNICVGDLQRVRMADKESTIFNIFRREDLVCLK